MAVIRHIGLKEVNGPLIILDNVENVAFDELVEIEVLNGQPRQGKVVKIEGKKVVIQVFEGTTNLSLENTKTNFKGKPLEIALSTEMIGRVFNGSGKPIDGFGEIFAEKYSDINGYAINPISRSYPRNFIQTGISSIDGLSTLIRGQKLPIFSDAGLPHNQLAVQIVNQAKIVDIGDNEEKDNFCIVFAAMGVKNDVADYFKTKFEESGVLKNVVMFLNLANDPIIERILTPRTALTAAEYLAFEKDMHVLVILTDITAYAEAVREISSSKGEIPGRKGYPGYLYSDLAQIYERAGVLKNSKGSVTQIPILTMPNGDITNPIPDLTGYITEGQIVLSKELDKKSIYPPVAILPSLSRLMKDGIGEGYTRHDHQDLANQLFASYAKVQEIRSLSSVIGEENLSEIDKLYISFGKYFESMFLTQSITENRDITETLDLGWNLLSILPKEKLDRLDNKLLDEFYDKKKSSKFNIKWLYFQKLVLS